MLDISRKTFGDDHAYTAQAYTKAGRAAAALGRRDEADQMFVRAASIIRGKGRKQDVDLAEALFERGKLLLGERRAAEALPLLRESLEIRESIMVPESSEIAQVRGTLANAEKATLR
jgi:tetratricopeptide (TPR) repeat protein